MNDKLLLAEFLKEETFNSKTEFYKGEENSELELVAKKHNIIFPSQDLALFKTTYARIDVANKNKVILPRYAVKEGLPTIIGKQINFNHDGKGKICGYILDGIIVKDRIIIYGCLFKSSFKKEFEKVVELFEKGELFVSYEIHKKDEDGIPVLVKKSGDNLEITKIIFHGCGLLLTKNPAEPEAKVIMMASEGNNEIKDKILDEEIVYAELALEKDIPEEGIKDNKGGLNVMEDTELAGQQKKAEENTAKAEETINAGATTVETKEEIKTTETRETKENGAIVSEVKTVGEITRVVTYDNGNKETFNEKVDNVRIIIWEEAEALKAEIAAKEAELNKVKGEIEILKTDVVNKDTEISILKSSLETKKYTDDDLLKAKEDTKKVILRKAELGDKAKEIKDEDLLDDNKFETIKAELNKNDDLSVGAVETGIVNSEVEKIKNKIDISAFPKRQTRK